jgi:hypothetical protein
VPGYVFYIVHGTRFFREPERDQFLLLWAILWGVLVMNLAGCILGWKVLIWLSKLLVV